MTEIDSGLIAMTLMILSMLAVGGVVSMMAARAERVRVEERRKRER